MSRVLKLGTRRSLLARSQSGWVARRLEAAHPGLRVELVGIDTRGDKILDVPLREVEGKEFFVQELDDALLSGRVDLTVHSMKDLSLDRPSTIRLAAVPEREDPRDILLFSGWSGGRPLKIGTSSPRRLENLPLFLAEAWPQPAPRFEWVEIRGNVNTRLSRLHEPEGSERRLDGVVLALAGLDRLWVDAEARIELEKLMRGLRWMIAPVTQSPAAPAQGALAIECRSDDSATLGLLRAIHDERAEASARAERAVLGEFGGGCHQRFGATSLHPAELGAALWIRGKDSRGNVLDQLRWNEPAKPSGAVKPWNGQKARGGVTHSPVDSGAHAFPDLSSAGPVFVAHARAVTPEWAHALAESGAPVWTSGFSSWKELARQGIWVQGCAEGLGMQNVAPVLKRPALGLPDPQHWTVLTHLDAVETLPPGWSGARVVPTYKVQSNYDEAERGRVAGATHLYWGSGAQFRNLGGLARKDAHHSCGPGRTVEALRAAGLKNVSVFPDASTWEKWIGGPAERVR
jgi:hydroxymethylbilane synthase